MKIKIGVMNFILVIIGVLTIVFTVTMIITFYKFGAIPDTLCTCFYGAMAGECGVMGVIKSMKIRYEDREWQKEDIKEAEKDMDRRMSGHE